MMARDGEKRYSVECNFRNNHRRDQVFEAFSGTGAEGVSAGGKPDLVTSRSG